MGTFDGLVGFARIPPVRCQQSGNTGEFHCDGCNRRAVPTDALRCGDFIAKQPRRQTKPRTKTDPGNRAPFDRCDGG